MSTKSIVGKRFNRNKIELIVLDRVGFQRNKMKRIMPLMFLYANTGNENSQGFYLFRLQKKLLQL